jgi:hypothetical protein
MVLWGFSTNSFVIHSFLLGEARGWSTNIVVIEYAYWLSYVGKGLCSTPLPHCLFICWWLLGIFKKVLETRIFGNLRNYINNIIHNVA